MAFFALLWKARTIEKYRLNYEKEKINSIVMGHTQMEQTLSQRWRHYRYDTQKRISRTFKQWYPDGSGVANFFLYLRTDQTFPNFLLKSVMGFVGGIILTYLCFMFFVFQLSISLIHATIMSSIIGVLLTLGLAFSYRIRCLVFLLIPQFFSRVGRHTLTCYALVLILTGPATNTLKNSEVLSESMACSQEQIKTSVHQLNDLIKKPYNSMKDSIKLMIDRLKIITMKVKESVVRLDRLVLSIVSLIQSSFAWLQSVADVCNTQLGTPYDRCTSVLQDGISDCKKTLGDDVSMLCNAAYLAQAACYSVKPFKAFCYVTDYMDEAILANVKKKLRNFVEHLRAMFHVEVHIHHSYSYSSNNSRSASQVAAGIVTEIRNRADPLLTWLSWSSCVTSLFLLLIIFRAKYYQHMYETRSRFDNRYVTKELQELDLKRQRQGRETVLPLNRRERAKYITTTSFRLVASEKVYLNRSAVFMAITTFKLLIHMVADYSLYWVLMTIRYHGRHQSDLMPGVPHSGVHVTGSGFMARLFRSIVGTLDIPLSFPAPSPISCLPDPYPPDFRRYIQIGVLIFLLWFFALFEPYGLRLRHLIMGHYRPERAKARATWLYNHILRTRAGFMKFARRKLHKEYKYSSEASLTLRQWMADHIPFQCLKSLLGTGPKELHCLLCGITSCSSDPDSQLSRCQTPNCPGIYCMSCFSDIGMLCTICLTPADYGDFSDVSLEKGSSDDSDSDADDGPSELKPAEEHTKLLQKENSYHSLRKEKSSIQRWKFFANTGLIQPQDTTLQHPTDSIPLHKNDDFLDFFATTFQSGFRRMKRNIKMRIWDKKLKYTHDWIAKLIPEFMFKEFSMEDGYDFYSNFINDTEQNEILQKITNSTRSIGINTDKNRGILINALINQFTRKKTKWSHKKHNEPKQDLILDKKLSHLNHKLKNRVLKNNLIESTKHFHAHNLTICQRNLKKVVSINKVKIKIYGEIKGAIKGIRYFMECNEGVSNTNQNNEIAPYDPPNGNFDEITKRTDNSNLERKKSKKKTSKTNKSKRPGKQKGVNKIRTKNSRHRITEFHTFFSENWNKIKYSLIPCTNTKTRPNTPLSNEKRNHKRRKKRKACLELNETNIEDCFAKKEIKQTRNLRISAFLAELEWTKRDYKKDKVQGYDDSFFFTDGVPAPITNKIVGMVQLKNLPFQWREAPRYEFCKCQDKKCTCEKGQSDKNLKFGPIPKHKIYAKKALERFRNKVKPNFNVDIAPSGLMQKMMSSVSAQESNPLRNESSICLSKRASYYQSFTKEMTQDSDAMDTDILFKNKHFMDDLVLDLSDDSESSKLFESAIQVGRDLIISRSSKEAKYKQSMARRCRCDLYDDIQRRWNHVKKSLSDKGFWNPLTVVKDFCSSLFGPSCTVDSCPNKRAKKAKEKQEKANSKRKKKGTPDKKKKVAVQTDPRKDKVKKNQTATQTQTHKDTETQLSTESEVNEKDNDQDQEPVREQEMEADEEENKKCERERQMLKECEMREKDKEEIEIPRQDEEMLINEKDSSGLEVKEASTPTNDESLTDENKQLQKMGAKDQEQYVSEDTTEAEREKILSSIAKEEQKLPPEKVDKGVHVVPEMAAGACQAIDCPNYCHRSIQYENKDTGAVNKMDEIGSVMCQCDRPLKKRKNQEHPPKKRQQQPRPQPQHQRRCPGGCGALETIRRHQGTSATPLCPPDCAYPVPVNMVTYKCTDEEVQGDVKAVCTCATQHISFTNRVSVGNDPSRINVNSFACEKRSPVANKKTQHKQVKQMAHKATHYTGRKVFGKKALDAKTGESKRLRKLSLERSMCLLERNPTDVPVTEVMPEDLTDTITDTSISSISLISDDTKTDTTICSLATVDYDETRRKKKFRIKVVTKTNQATLTDKARLCDTGTTTGDWWSPIIERRANDEILLEKKKGYNTIEKQQKEKELRELKELRKRRRTCGVTTDGRIVTFRSRTQIIPTALLPGANKDVMSPSRYLLESQKYYNELFAYNVHPPPQVDPPPHSRVSQMPKYQDREKIRSPLGSRRNHHHKTKRLDECYSPKRQVTPRRRYNESSNTRTSESPRRRSYTHRHSKNRYYYKLNSPRKFL